MKTSPRGIEDLVLSEGLRTKAYRDSGGLPTIGVGHTSAAGPPAVTMGMTITRQEALDIFARDLAKFEARVNRVFPNGLSQSAFDGSVSFDFNTGSINSASWPTHYKAGRLDSAERNLRLWNKVKGTVIPGLTTRRAHEADLIFRGKYRTPLKNEPLPPPAPADPVLRLGDGIGTTNLELRPLIADAQILLKVRGFDPGVADGKFGARTESMTMMFQRQRGLIDDGVIGPKTWAALRMPNPASAVMGDGETDEPQPKETTMFEGKQKAWMGAATPAIVASAFAILGMMGITLDPAVMAGVISVLTGLGVYQVKNEV